MADLLTNLAAAAGQAGGEGAYIEDVFSTYLYTGTNAALTITNGIDLDGEGGLVWTKTRSGADDHELIDTAKGRTKALESNTANAERTNASSSGITSFNSDGYSLGVNDISNLNENGIAFVSWSFRKSPKFFDVVTYTGTGVARTVSHNLGSVPGCIMVKRTDTTGDWQVYHRANTANPETDYLVLNSTAATADSNTRWNDTAPTDSVFSLGTEATVNASGGTYVAYLFAHDAGGFGDDGEQNVISCGSFVTDGSGNATVTLGWEPQFIISKASSTAGFNWDMFDSMRGFPVSGTSARLRANTSNVEGTTSQYLISNTGFVVSGFSASTTTVYIAIRRGPMKTPTAGTEVFSPVAYTGNNVSGRNINTGFVTDSVLGGPRASDVTHIWDARLTGGRYLETQTTSSDSAGFTGYDTQNGYLLNNTAGSGWNNSSYTYIRWAFRRAPGFFDVVCYTGNGTASTQITHNLGVAPELIILKLRSSSGNSWRVWYSQITSGNSLFLNLTNAQTAETSRISSASSTTFTLNDGTSGVNGSGATYVAYLFASLAGVSDIGSYTGNGTSVSVTTGFQPRFILVKRTDSTGNWYVGDSARGLVAGDDPFLELNTTDAEVTNEDWVDVSATGFTINETAANANVDTGTYLYLAIS